MSDDDDEKKYILELDNTKDKSDLYMPVFPLYNYPQNSVENIIPECYKNIPIKFINLDKFGDETLIYIYFNLKNKELVNTSFYCLKKRDIYYSNNFKAFVFLNCKKEICNQKKRVVIFDHLNWSREEKDVLFDRYFINSLKE